MDDEALAKELRDVSLVSEYLTLDEAWLAVARRAKAILAERDAEIIRRLQALRGSSYAAVLSGVDELIGLLTPKEPT